MKEERRKTFALLKLLSRGGAISPCVMLQELMAFAAGEIGAVAGDAYFVNSATCALEHRVSWPDQGDSRALRPVPNEARKAFATRTLVPSSGENLATMVAMPLLAGDNAVGALCFSFPNRRKGAEPPDSAITFSKEQLYFAEAFWNKMQAPDVRAALWDSLLATVWEEIRTAGEAPLELEKELHSFVDNLLEAFRKSPWPRLDMPDMVYVQLVDPLHGNIRTIHGTGLPLSFNYIPAHSIHSKDIQADIVRTRLPQYIAGHDPDRFDTRIFNQYNHKDYVRFWHPLFPFPAVSEPENSPEHILSFLENALEWEPEQQHNGEWATRKAGWRNELIPPIGLIYGTVEIGYRKENNVNHRLEAWTPELANWAMANSLALAPRLFKTTPAGVLERIGRALALFTPGKSFQFCHAYSPTQLPDVREYPVSPPWTVAPPGMEAHCAEKEGGSWTAGQPRQEEPVTLIWNKEFNSQEFPMHAEWDVIQQEAERRAREALEVAVHIFRDVFYPQELLVPDRTPEVIGMEVKEAPALEICEEAAQMTGASLSLLYFFIVKSEEFSDQPWYIRPPTKWTRPGEGALKFSQDEVETLARKAVKIRIAQYEHPIRLGGRKGSVSLLPLELSESVVCVLLLFFPWKKRFEPAEKANIERLIPRWVYRTHFHHLISHYCFSELTRRLRSELIEAGRTACHNPGAGAGRLLTFFDDFLMRSFGLLASNNVKIVLLTLQEQSRQQPETHQTSRYWRLALNGDDWAAGHEVFSKDDFSGPCYMACEKERPVFFSGKKKREQLQGLLSSLRNKALEANNQGDTDRENKLNKFVSVIDKHEDTPSTLITFPVMLQGERKGRNKAACTWILEKDLYFDEEHRLLLKELGEALADNMHQVRSAELRHNEKKSNHSLDELSCLMACSRIVDEVFGRFIHWLADKASIAQDIVAWLPDSDSSRLVARSCKGRIWEALRENSQYEVIDLKQHPLVGRMEFQTKKRKLKLMENQPVPWSMPLNPDRNHISGLERVYAEINGCNWLVSFPIQDAAGQILGFVDCLRKEPLSECEEAVLGQQLARASIQFYAKIIELHFQKSQKLTNDLFSKTKDLLRSFRINEAYGMIVRDIRDFIKCEQCDLFFEQSGAMILLGTTREGGPEGESERFRFSVSVNPEGGDLLSRCLANGHEEIQHAGACPPTASSSGLSPDLEKLLANSLGTERLVAPLRHTDSNNRTIVGILHLESPKPHYRKKGDYSRADRICMKRTLKFSSEELDFAMLMAPALHRNLKTVQLVEEQAWLVRDLVHSLGHPLQTLRSSVNSLLRCLARPGGTLPLNWHSLNDEVEYSFKIVEDARQRWSYFTSPQTQSQRNEFKSMLLKEFIVEICDFMAPLADKYKTHISYAAVKSIAPLPLFGNWLRIALVNLLENACKYSWKERTVCISLEETPYGHIVIQVNNQGIGIPVDDLNKVFDAYYRSSVPDRKGLREGTGIGLAIVKRAIKDVHGGDVKAESLPIGKQSMETGGSPEHISNLEHRTTFTIRLNRATLENLAGIKE